MAPGGSELADGETLNSALSTAADDIVSVVVPLFWIFTLSVLDVPSSRSPKERLVRMEKTGATPVPVTATESGEPNAEWVKRMYPERGPVPPGAKVR
jgi:hypothetical protein